MEETHISLTNTIPCHVWYISPHFLYCLPFSTLFQYNFIAAFNSLVCSIYLDFEDITSSAEGTWIHSWQQLVNQIRVLNAQTCKLSSTTWYQQCTKPSEPAMALHGRHVVSGIKFGVLVYASAPDPELSPWPSIHFSFWNAEYSLVNRCRYYLMGHAPWFVKTIT